MEYSPEKDPDDEEEKDSYLADTQHPLLLVLMKHHWAFLMSYMFYIELDVLNLRGFERSSEDYLQLNMLLCVILLLPTCIMNISFDNII